MDAYFVLGLGLSGLAAAGKLLEEGAKVKAWDDSLSTRDPSEHLKALLGRGLELDPEGWMTSDECIVSPGIPPTHPIYAAAVADGIPVSGEVELALRSLPNPCVAVSGTNGKTTVALLAAHLLRSAGVSARAVGNIGVPLCQLDCPPSEVLVIELSSYQIDTMRSPRLSAAALLNITPDHLDRYGSMEAYAASKARLGDLLLPRGEFWVEGETAQLYSSQFSSRKPRLYGCGGGWDMNVGAESLRTDRGIEYILPLGYRTKSKHDRLNSAAALALCMPFCAEEDGFLRALETFVKPEHRLESVACIDGISYVNDSKGTNVAAVQHAVDSTAGPLWLIAGGVDKGGSYGPWKEAFKDKVQGLALIGEAAARIRSDLGEAMLCHDCDSLADAIEWTRAKARKGDTVLLSPGCSSFDMFRNYAHRGEEFKRLVCELEGVVKE